MLDIFAITVVGYYNQLKLVLVFQDPRRRPPVLVGSGNQGIHHAQPSEAVPERADLRAESGKSVRSLDDFHNLLVCDIFRARRSGDAVRKDGRDRSTRLLLSFVAVDFRFEDVFWVSLFTPVHHWDPTGHRDDQADYVTKFREVFDKTDTEAKTGIL